MSIQTTYTATDLPPGRDEQFEQGLRRVRETIGDHLLWIGGERRPGSAGAFEEFNPAHTRELLGSFASAGKDDVASAVEAARVAQRKWRRTPVADRVAVMSRAADEIERRAGEFSAALSLEVGKNRLEAVGEVDEAVELIRYYSRQALGDFEVALQSSGASEHNVSVLRPFGVFAVIAPFNFPLALILGPSVAAMLAGNAVVAKPSPTTSLTSLMLAEVFDAAELPAGVFNVVTGGDSTGRALVSAEVDGMVFTGSYAVGRQIAATFVHDAGYARPCIVEMGGKNPAIVTANADLTVAAAGIVRSAFGLSGQKCSACSRVLVDSTVHDALVPLLVEAAAEWTVADPIDRACRVGPVHTADAGERFERAVAEAVADGEILHGGAALRDGEFADGHYVEPTIVSELPVGHRLVREEQFLPLVVVERVRSLDEALRRANDQVYGLTAGFFGSEAESETFLEEIQAGTVFVNRGAGATSGGWPGQQSYVGWKGSGSTSRGALGPRYVEQFLREQGRNVVRVA